MICIWRWRRHRSITPSALTCTRGIHVWACAPWMGAPTRCKSLLVAGAPFQGAHTCLVRTGGIRFAQTAGYWAETPSASFLPSRWCEQRSQESVKFNQLIFNLSTWLHDFAMQYKEFSKSIIWWLSSQRDYTDCEIEYKVNYHPDGCEQKRIDCRNLPKSVNPRKFRQSKVD